MGKMRIIPAIMSRQEFTAGNIDRTYNFTKNGSSVDPTDGCLYLKMVRQNDRDNDYSGSGACTTLRASRHTWEIRMGFQSIAGNVAYCYTQQYACYYLNQMAFQNYQSTYWNVFLKWNETGEPRGS